MLDAYSTNEKHCHSFFVLHLLSFFIVAIYLGVFVATPVFGQAEYSDAYTIDNSGQTYDSSTDTVYVPDSAPVPQMVGIGVSEDNYTSNTYSTSTYTTLSSPDGRVISAGSDGYTYSVAEAISLEVDPQTAVEGDYNVSSEHTYYQEQVDPCSPYCTYKNSKNVTGVFSKQAVFYPTSLSSPLFIIRYTYAIFPIRIVAIAYQWANTGLGCNDPNYRWAYLLYCPTSSCSRARACAGGAYPFVQGVGLRINYGFGIVRCYMRYYYAAFPWCR